MSNSHIGETKHKTTTKQMKTKIKRKPPVVEDVIGSCRAGSSDLFAKGP